MMLSAESSSLTSFIQFITVLILFISVLAVTFLVTRWLGGYQREKLRGTNVEVIETIKIAPGKYVEIIRTADKYMAVAIGKDTVTMLTELDENAVIRHSETAEVRMNFQDIMNKVRSGDRTKNDRGGDA